MKKVKVLWVSDGVTPTGFSRVSHSIIKYLDKKKYDITMLAINYFGDPHPYPFKIYPCNAIGDMYGEKRLAPLLELIEPDLIFMLNDAPIITRYLEIIKKHYADKLLPKIVTYIPVDAENHDGAWYKDFDIVTQPVFYTQFGKEVVNKCAPDLKTEVIPHGIDKETFFKIDKPRQELRKEYYQNAKDVDVDSFIVLSAQRNQPRKKLDITMEAFAIFAHDKPENVRLHMHCGVRDASLDILKMANRLGIRKRLILSSLNNGVQQIPSEKLNRLYNVTDIGVNTSLGEGWALVNIEHAVTGAPQVLAGHSALNEIYNECGILVQPAIPWTFDNVMTRGWIVRPDDFAIGLDMLYKDKELYSILSERCLLKFNSPYYDWKEISKMWDDLFTKVLND